MKKSWFRISICFVLALGITIAMNWQTLFQPQPLSAGQFNVNSVVAQQVEGQRKSAANNYKVLIDGQLIGYLSSMEPANQLLHQIYTQRYQQEFPGSEIVFGNRISISAEPSFLIYENKDEEIIDAIEAVDEYLLSTTAVDFSDANGTYATIYVSNTDMYEQALVDYLALFVGSEDLEIISHGGTTATLSEYGERDISIEIEQTISLRPSYAKADEIFTRYDQVYYYLKYGTLSELEYTEVQPYESIYALASRYGLDAERLRIINAETIRDVDQVLPVGTILCVTWLQSPIDVTVTKETLTQEIVYPDSPIYVEDETIRLGESVVQQEEVNGSRNVLRRETWVNGMVADAEEVSSQTTILPQQAIIRQGSREIPSVGTGTWRWPVDVPRITSRVAWDPVVPGYSGHNGTDIQNYYDRYGPIYAVDNGVVEYVGYDSIRGNWCLINHNNGVKSQYNHMNQAPFVEVGQVVQKGDIIGQIGTTGVTTGPHVHLGVWIDGVAGNACDGFLDCSGLDW